MEIARTGKTNKFPGGSARSFVLRNYVVVNSEFAGMDIVIV